MLCDNEAAKRRLQQRIESYVFVFCRFSPPDRIHVHCVKISPNPVEKR